MGQIGPERGDILKAKLTGQPRQGRQGRQAAERRFKLPNLAGELARRGQGLSTASKLAG